MDVQGQAEAKEEEAVTPEDAKRIKERIMPSTLNKLGGIAAVGSGAMLIVGELMYLVVGVGESMEGSAEVVASFAGVVQSMIFLLAGVLLVGAVISLYARHAVSTGSLGLAGFLVAFFGTILAAGAFWDGAFVTPAIASEAPSLFESEPPALVNFGLTLSFVLFSAGWTVFGITLLKARALPRPATSLLILGAILAFVPVPFTYIPFGIAVAWTSLMSLSLENAALDEPTRTVK